MPERVRRAFLQNTQQGRRAGGPRPFGYEDNGITVREPEAAAVRAAAESVLAGASLRSVARDLTATGPTTSMKSRAWDAHSVRAVGLGDLPLRGLRATIAAGVHRGPGCALLPLRAAANAARARLAEIAEMLGDDELTRVEAQIARSHATTWLEHAEAEIAAATSSSPLAGIVDAPDPAAVWAGLDP